MGRKYDDEAVVEQAKGAIREQGLKGFQELATALDIPPRSLRDLLNRQGIAGFDDLVSKMKLNDVDDIELLRRQLAHWKKLVKRQRQKLLDRDWIKKELASQISVMEPVAFRPPEVGPKSYHEQIAVLELSDLHYGLNIPAEPLGILFEGINPDIVTNRLEHTFDTFARLAKAQSFPANEVRIFILGDLIEHSHMRPAQAKTT